MYINANTLKDFAVAHMNRIKVLNRFQENW